MTLLPDGPIQAQCENATIDAGTLRGDVTTKGGTTRFTARLDDEGRLAGSLGKGDGAAVGSFVLEPTPDPEQLAGRQRFAGKVALPNGRSFELAALLACTETGRYVVNVDLATQNAFDIPLVDVRAEAGEGHTRVQATLIGRTDTTLRFDLDPQSDRLPGTFVQGHVELPFELARASPDAAGPSRPQHPNPPFPYRSKTVVATHPEGHILAGTLTLPDATQFGSGPYAAVALVSGSGPQDRDETIMGHKPFLVLADRLTRAGIAVMRYDDRGVGESTGAASLPQATTADFATDTTAVVAQLRARRDIDGDRIGLVGHSEGGTIALIVAANDPKVAFVTLMAGPCVPGSVVASRQIALSAQADGASTEATERLRSTLARALTLSVAPKTDAAEAAEALTIAARSHLEALNAEVTKDRLARATGNLRGLLARPWDRYFLEHDPTDHLLRIRCPILALNGTKDLAVWHEDNLGALRRLAGHRENVEIVALPGLNHLFQPCETGRQDEYASIETTIDEKVLDTIVRWVTTVTRRQR
ncbi:MAG: alpha/beta hydrolase [Planctomycetota bacterium]